MPLNENSLKYITTNLFEARASDAGSFSILTPGHANLQYHQVVLVSSGAIASGSYKVRMASFEGEQQLEHTAYVGKVLQFDGERSAFVNFAGILRGISLELFVAIPAGETISCILSSGNLPFEDSINTVVHNSMSGLQGGAAGEYYHLTAAQYAALGSGNYLFADGSIPLTADWDVGGYSLDNVKSVALDTVAGVSVAEGEMAWNADEGTVDIGMSGGVVLQAGQETHWNVRNNSGVPIAEGKAVMATGTLGASGRITIGLMDGSSIANAKYFLGIATETINNGSDGKVTSLGKVRGIKTDYATWADGQVLWVDNATPGDLTNVEPTSGSRLPIAFIIYTASSNGTLAVRATDGTYLGEAHDTAISSAALNQALIFNGTAWANQLLNAQLAPPDLSTGITAFATGGQASATELDEGVNVVSTVVTEGDSVKLPTAVAKKIATIHNAGANSLDLFPGSSDAIAIFAVDTAVPVAPQSTITLFAIDATTWIQL